MGGSVGAVGWIATLLVLVIGSESVQGEESKRNESKYAKPDYSVYHTKDETLQEVERIVQSEPKCKGVMSLEYVTDEDEEDGYSAKVGVVTYDVDKNSKGGDDHRKVKVLLDFGEHGRELISAEVGLGFLKALCDDVYMEQVLAPYGLYDGARDVLDRLAFKIVTMENENGRAKVEKGDLCERKNGRGVDPNRNWGVDWGVKEPDYDPKEEYPGEKAFSEPEVRVMKGLVEQVQPDVFINVHSGMEALFVPYDHKKSIPYGKSINATISILKELNSKFCNGNCSIGSGGATVGYLAHGTATDYIYSDLGVEITMTWEIYGDLKADFNDCFRMFNPIGESNVKAFVDRWVASLLFFMLKLPSHAGIDSSIFVPSASISLGRKGMDPLMLQDHRVALNSYIASPLALYWKLFGLVIMTVLLVAYLCSPSLMKVFKRTGAEYERNENKILDHNPFNRFSWSRMMSKKTPKKYITI